MEWKERYPSMQEACGLINPQKAKKVQPNGEKIDKESRILFLHGYLDTNTNPSKGNKGKRLVSQLTFKKPDGTIEKIPAVGQKLFRHKPIIRK